MATINRKLKCTGTAEQPHDEVQYSAQWHVEERGWVNPDELACWMCGRRTEEPPEPTAFNGWGYGYRIGTLNSG